MKEPTNQKGKWLYLGTALSLVMLLVFVSCRDEEHFDRDPSKGITLEEQLRANPDFSTFVQALENTGILVDVGSSGLWTVFAPTNAAMEGLNINPTDEDEKVELKKLLSYHIGLGLRHSSAIKSDDDRLITRASKYVSLSKSPFAADSKSISNPNIEANNAVIHALDQRLVLIPNTAETVREESDLSLFSEALESFRSLVFNRLLSTDRNRDGIIDDSVFLPSYSVGNDLAVELNRKTIFAPTNEAVVAYLNGIGKTSLMELSTNDLKNFINQHIVGDNLPSASLVENQEYSTIGDSGSFIFTSSILVPGGKDIKASNGLVHKINTVLAND